MLLSQHQHLAAALPPAATASTTLLQDVSRLITLHRNGHSQKSVSKGFRNYVSTVRTASSDRSW
jgi:hypothetical protein